MEGLDPRSQRSARREHLRVLLVADVVEVEKLADVVEAEADRLATQDPGQARAIAIGVEPGGPSPLRRDQLFVFVESKRPGQ
jgi:hypothetical protein